MFDVNLIRYRGYEGGFARLAAIQTHCGRFPDVGSLYYTKFAFCIIATKKSFPQNIVFPSVTPPLPVIPHQKRSSQNQSPRFQLINLIACRKQYPCLPASHRVSRRRRRERGLKKKDTHFAKCACMSAATRRPAAFPQPATAGLKFPPRAAGAFYMFSLKPVCFDL